MGRMKRKGEEGEAVEYMTRPAAIRKLQISLQEFRKLCIIKGVFPREPKRKLAGKDKTYYLTKDIMFLMHDPILAKFREQKTWRKRMTKAQGRKEKLKRLKEIERQKPKYSLAHIVKERYPSFIDALRDLDDALCMIHLFAQLSADGRVDSKQVNMCRRLSLEFQSYIIRERALRKVFLSIKGIYYQVEVMGEKITWISPYQFAQEVPQFVDVGVMLNFLEFNETLLGFINYKLFHDLGLNYPPQIDTTKADNGEGLFSLILAPVESEEVEEVKTSVKKASGTAKSLPSSIEKKLATANQPEAMEEESEDENEEEAAVFQSDLYQETRQLEDFQKLFANCFFFLSTEVPKESLEFIILCFGGQVSWDGDCSPYDRNDERITHYIIDRDSTPTSKFTRAFVQPQWVYDSINNGILLPTEEYGIHATLPAHLSPFVNDESEGYEPKRAKQLRKMVASAKGEEIMDDSDDDNSDVDESDDEVQEERYLKELQAERKGITFSDATKDDVSVTKTKKVSKKQLAMEEEEQRKQFAKTMIPSRRRRRLYDNIKNSQRRKAQSNNVLVQKSKILQNAAKKQQEEAE